MKNKIFARIIITTLLVTFLTFNVGKVNRVSAIGTTIAASAAAALCAVGIVYCSYMALSGASVNIPQSDDIIDWLRDMGNKVVQYPSGRAAYEELYPELIGVGDEPLTDMLDRAWTWTSDKLKSWANDFSSTNVIENIATFEYVRDVSQIPTNTFDYAFTFISVPELVRQYGINYTFTEFEANNHVTITDYIGYGPTIIYNIGSRATIMPFMEQIQVRNCLRNGRYYTQKYENGEWVDFQPNNYLHSGRAVIHNNGTITYLGPSSTFEYYVEVDNPGTYGATAVYYPPLPNSDIYIEATDELIEAVPLDTHVVVRNPQWPTLPPEDDNKSVIPYTKLPFDPNWIDPVTGSPGGGNWGFNLAQLLDKLEALAGLLMEIGAIGELINQFKNLLRGQAGDEYYIYYDDSEHNETFYQYYTITNYNGDVYQYDIDVSDADEHLPVDLNTIQVYTDNNYVNSVKGHARKFGEAIGEYVAFWHNSDPESLYTILGSFVVILIGAFIGKWGHS